MATRRERVILEVEDRFTTTMAKAAASAALLGKTLDDVDKKSVTAGAGLDKSTRSVTQFETSLRRSGSEIDQFSGRVRLLAETAAVLGPSLVPIGAAAVPAIAALATGLGAAAGAAGVAALAFNGIGDALDAIDKAQLEPTVENMQAMESALAGLGPAGAAFATYLDSLEPRLHALQDVARAGLFPGVQEGLEALTPLLPQVRNIIGEIAEGMGRLAADAGEALSGDGFAAFFDYLEVSAGPTLEAFGRSIGNLAEGFGNLIVAFDPLTRDFTGGLLSMSQAFADWSAQLSATDGFKDFVWFVRDSVPMVSDLLGSISNAFVSIVQAVAPMGQAVVPVLTLVADTFSAIASSPIGPELFTAAAGFIALNRASKILGPGLSSISEAFLDLRTSPNRAATAMERFGGAARTIAGGAGMGLFVTSLGEANDGLRTFEGVAGGALAGFAVGGPWGAAIGGAVGALGSLAGANESTSAYVRELTGSLNEQTGALTENSRQVAAKALEDAGALSAAEALGLNLDVVTSAALGNKDAMKAVADELSRYANVDTPSGVDMEMLKQRQAGEDLMHTLKELSGETESTVAAEKRVAQAAGQSTGAMQRQSEALVAARSAAARTATSFIGLGDSLNDSKVSLGDWIKQLQQQADALRNFRRNAEEAANRGLRQGLIDALREAGPEGAMRMKQLANATDAEIGKANKAWQSGQREIKRYTDLVGGVPKSKSTTLNVDSRQAMQAIDAARSALNRIDRYIPVTIHVSRSGVDAGSGLEYLSGGAFAAGGFTHPSGAGLALPNDLKE